MKLQRLHLENFRRFSALNIEFEEDVTVIVARNGQGKTTVLEAAVIALGPFIGAFEHGQSPNIRAEDARYMPIGTSGENEQQFPVRLQGELRPLTIPGPPEDKPRGIQWERALNSAKGRTTRKEARPLSDYGDALQKQLRHDASIQLPLIVYYSSQRLWTERKNTRGLGGNLTRTRTYGYENCLGLSSSYKEMERWLRHATLAETQERARNEASATTLADRIEAIQNAVNTIVEAEGWSNFHYNIRRNKLVLQHEDHGILPLANLSDGLRAMITMTADIAFRAVRLNGELGKHAPTQTKGIVLIDEVGLHLHPAWEQRVVHSLTRAFPAMQFIVTTHSPQVLSTIASKNIRIIQRVPESDAFEIHRPDTEVRGLSSEYALSEAFNVDPIPPTYERETYQQALKLTLDQTEEFKQLRQELVDHFSATHPWVESLDHYRRMLRLQQRIEDAKTKAPV